MKSIAIPFINKEKKEQKNSHKNIIDFYEEATEDYLFWSKDLNMHFGYFKLGKTSPFKRDSMLNEMNNQIYNRLQLSKRKNVVADLGCGMGATMRSFLNISKNLSVIGLTLSPFQVREGNKLIKGKNAIILQENYCQTSLKTNSMDGVIGVESLCHSGHSKEALEEAYRILKPNGKFVIADAFIRKEPSKLCYGSSLGYQKLCKYWSLDGLGIISNVKENLSEIGFKNITIENTSLRIAPSVLHVPFAICGFILKSILSGKPIKQQSWNNLKASFFALLSGLHLKDFGYYIITATKK